MTGGHEELHVLAGAFVLGGLSDDDHRVFSAHLRDCSICQHEVGQFGSIPRLLGLVAEPEPRADERPTEPMADVTDLLSLVRARRRRSRWGVAVAAAALVAVSLGGGVLWGQATARPATASLALTAAPAAGGSAAAQVGLVAKGWGTQLEVAAKDLPRSGSFTLWVVDAAGHETQIGTWSATPSEQATIVAPCATYAADIRAVHIRTSAGETLASAVG